MPKLRKLAGKELVRILCNEFGFKSIRQKGSHVLLIKYINGTKIGCVVPLHDELKLGTLKAILKQARISEEELVKPLR
jgi:predicted RNA binding protein YcfA (HicA-like mRNA interferase family)